MSQKTRLSSAYGLSFMAIALAINNSLFISLIPLAIAAYLVRDLFLKKRHPSCLPAVLAAAIANTVIYLLGFRYFTQIGLAFTVSIGLLIIFNIFYTYSLLQASRKQMKKALRINIICTLAVIIITILSDLLIKITLPGFDVGVLPGFWMLLLIMVISILPAIPVAVKRGTSATSSLKRKMS